MTEVVIDCAGAHIGGAAKFLAELTNYLERHPREDVKVLGRRRSLTPTWLARREAITRAGARRIALNNASFIAPGGKKVVLLRNALHFAMPSELDVLRYSPSRVLRVQTHVVRALTRRADEVVVPCTDMAERVVHHVPSVADRVTVRMHPVSNNFSRIPLRLSTKRILMPIINAPYKNLQDHLSNLLLSLHAIGDNQTRITATATREEFTGSVSESDRIDFIGPQRETVLKEHWAAATAVYYPTRLESFGYPLAECRVAGIPVIALGSPQNREIAGAALCPIEGTSSDALSRALEQALTNSVARDPAPFDPDKYFTWLIGPSSA